MKRQEEEVWDDLTPPTPEELEQARGLREALDQRGEHPDEEFCRAIRIVQDPPQLDPRVNEWLVKRAMHRVQPKRGRVVVVLFGAGTALALAAGVAFVLSGGLWTSSVGGRPVMAEASLIPSRSTQSLFEEPFERHGGTSSRIDRISRERAKDYRSNRFLSLGVRP